MNHFKVGNHNNQYVSGICPLINLQQEDSIYVSDKSKSYGGDIKKVHKSTSIFKAFECEDHVVYLESDDNDGLYVAVGDKSNNLNIISNFHADIIYNDGTGYLNQGRIRCSIKDLF